MKNNKVKAGLLILAMGGSLAVGTAVGRPDCDYVIAGEDKEICLSQEQVEQIELILEGSAGFGGFKFGGGVDLKNLLEQR